MSIPASALVVFALGAAWGAFAHWWLASHPAPTPPAATRRPAPHQHGRRGGNVRLRRRCFDWTTDAPEVR